ncbi:MAG TPA: pyrroloquinoline quinone biosynthesis protein PqqE [Polyangiaceae bacterium]|nr:pyrroloquinoline quinone biosynthesis protein PqqE [Polyangiaceae bacterium]
MTPRLRRGVRVRPDPRDGAPILLSPERGLRLSPTAAATVALLDGAASIEAVVGKLAAAYPTADRARIDGDVRALLQDLRARGLVEGVEAGGARSAPRAEEDGRNDEDDPAPAAAPYTLVAELTHRCPLACPYCSNPRALVGGHEELTTAEWLRVVDDAAAMGVMQLHLSGGEPLARADLEAIAARAHERDLYVSLVTSGLPLDRARLERLAPSLDHVQLSVQDAAAASSDRIAGTVSFDAKMRIAAWVKELGLPLTLNTVLHRENIDRVRDVVALAERLGADRLELANVQLVSWALENRAALLPSAASLDAARAVAAEARGRLEGRMQVVFVLPDWHADRPRACMDGWGRRFAVLAPDGAVLPCQAARALPLVFETVRSRPLAEVWADGEALAAYRGDAWMRDPCKTCDRRAIDYGGCRCQAFALTGDAAATDPACALAPEHALVRAARAEAERPAARRFVYRGR